MVCSLPVRGRPGLRPSTLLDIDQLCRLNRGGPRLIDSKRAGVKVHRSVKTRMDAEYEMGGSKYEPRPGLLNVIWVD